MLQQYYSIQHTKYGSVQSRELKQMNIRACGGEADDVARNIFVL